MNEHSKLPWRSVYAPGSKQRCAAIESQASDVYVYLNVAKHDDMPETIERWKEDAALIERAVNAHALLLEALEILYDKYENGDPCFEDGDPSGSSMGNAVQLSYEEENKVLAAFEACGIETALSYPRSESAHV